jgi:hypothetical protein
MNNVIKDIDALRKENPIYVKIFGEERELARLKMEDHAKLNELDFKVDNIARVDKKEQAKVLNEMREVVKKLIPSLAKDQLKELLWDDYLWIREAVDERVMMDRGLNSEEIKKAINLQRRRILGL